ncbi:MAG: transcription termination/antitermination protein NusG [Christensenellaceae bacterium]|jgi:transcriptional antiterminator NusG|nr:transcription termination/antitermination protein NusG [Christensenellaceae bacterium]
MADEKELSWYVVHTYSGYENKVMDSLQKMVDNQNLHDIIKEIRVPIEEVVEIKNGRRHIVPRKVFPGYVLVRMIMNDESWYVVRNTRGVTGFVGPGSRPIPLTDEEVAKMGVDGRKQVQVNIDVGDQVTILAGTLEGFNGTVQEVDLKEGKIKVGVVFFGRETSVDLDYDQVNRA